MRETVNLIIYFVHFLPKAIINTKTNGVFLLSDAEYNIKRQIQWSTMILFA